MPQPPQNPDHTPAHQLVYVGLGSNLGPSRRLLAVARRALSALSDTPLAASALYLSEPWGPIAQRPYFNQVVALWPKMGPDETLHALLQIERSLGRDRRREQRFGPRSLDLDLLIWPALRRDDPQLTLPHPRLHLRRFVLQPLHDLAPGLRPPGEDRTVAELLAQCPDRAWVRLAQDSDGEEPPSQTLASALSQGEASALGPDGRETPP